MNNKVLSLSLLVSICAGSTVQAMSLPGGLGSVVGGVASAVGGAVTGAVSTVSGVVGGVATPVVAIVSTVPVVSVVAQPVAAVADNVSAVGLATNLVAEGVDVVQCAEALYAAVQSADWANAFNILQQCGKEAKELLSAAIAIADANNDMGTKKLLEGLTTNYIQQYPYQSMAAASVIAFIAGYLTSSWL